MKREDVRFFDPRDEYSVAERVLPHWVQGGTLCFITWRLADSLPRPVLQRLDQDVAATLSASGLSPEGDWKTQLHRLPPAERARIHWKLFLTRDKYLDAGCGRCLLAKREHAEEVVRSLRRFDEERYFLTDLIVMPNHVHFLAAFADADQMLAQCTAWKRYLGRKINAAEHLRGPFWQKDQFDHLVRGEEEFDRYRRYIEENPRSAGLKEGEYLHYRKELLGEGSASRRDAAT